MAGPKGKAVETALVALLANEDAARRIAGAIVIGDLDLYSPEAVAGLRKLLSDSDAVVRRRAAQALGALSPDGLAADLQPLLVDPVGNVRDAVRTVLAEAKNIGPSDLEAMLDAKDEGERIGAVAVMAARADPDSMDRLARAMGTVSQRIVEAGLSALESSLPTASGAAVGAFIEGLRAHVDPKRLDERPALAESLSELLGGSEHEAALSVLMGWTAKCKNPDARAAAAGALRRQTSSRKLSARQYESLLEILEDPKTPESVLAPLSEALVQADLPMTHEPRVRKLLGSETRAVRVFALRALGGLDSAPAAKAVAEFIVNADSADRKTALGQASETASGRTALAKLLVTLEDSTLAETVAQALRASDGLLHSTIQLLEKGALDAPPAVSKVILTLLKQLGVEGVERVQGSLLAKARELRDRGDVAEAIKLLERVTEASDDPGARFELGVAQLQASKKIISKGSKGDASVQTFRALARRRDFPALDRLVKEKGLGDDALFFLGFSLCEGQGDAQNLGGDILTHLTESAEDAAIKRRARNKLVTMGWLE